MNISKFIGYLMLFVTIIIIHHKPVVASCRFDGSRDSPFLVADSSVFVLCDCSSNRSNVVGWGKGSDTCEAKALAECFLECAGGYSIKAAEDQSGDTATAISKTKTCTKED